MLTISKTCYFTVNLLRWSPILFKVFKTWKNVYYILSVPFYFVCDRVHVSEEIYGSPVIMIVVLLLSQVSALVKNALSDDFPTMAVYSAVTSWIHPLMFLVIVKNFTLSFSSLFCYRRHMKTMESMNIFSEMTTQTKKPMSLS